MSGITFESLKTNLKTLFGWVSLANWFSTIFCIFICSFLDIHLFLISCNLFQFRNLFWTFSTHFCSFTNRFRSFLLVYQSFLPVSARLTFVQSFLLIYPRSHQFFKRDLNSEFQQLESFLASHFITAFQIKKRQKRYERLIFGVYFPQEDANMPSEKFFRA